MSTYFLKSLKTYNEGRGIGIGIPTIDRLFYKSLSQDNNLDDVHQIEWIPRIKKLHELGLVQKVRSGKDDILTSEGRKMLKKYRGN